MTSITPMMAIGTSGTLDTKMSKTATPSSGTFSSFASISSVRIGNQRRNVVVQRNLNNKIKAMAKEVIYNENARSAIAAGVNVLAAAVRVTLGPKGRNVVIERQFEGPEIGKNDVTVPKEIELENRFENTGSGLLRQAASETNDLAGDGKATSIVLTQALISEGVKVVAAGADGIQIAMGMERTTQALVEELKQMSKEVEDSELADVAAVSAGNDPEVGSMIAEAILKVGRQGEVTIEEGKTVETTLHVVNGMQFDGGYLSPYFITDTEKLTVEFENCKLLLVDQKVTNAQDIVQYLEDAKKGEYPILFIAEDIEEEALSILVVNKLREVKVAAVKAPGFGERKSQYLDDIAVLTGGTVIREGTGLTLGNAGSKVLGLASKVVVTKDTTTIVSNGSTQASVDKQVSKLRNLLEEAEQDDEKEKLNERIANLSGGVAVIQVGAQTETELHEKKLRMKKALNATKAAIEEGVVVGGGCALFGLSSKVDSVKDTLDNDEQKVGADIVKSVLGYPMTLIAENAGVSGSEVMEKVLASNNPNFGYNAATGEYEDLMAAGIIDPTKVVRGSLENASSVAKTFLTPDVVVSDLS